MICPIKTGLCDPASQSNTVQISAKKKVTCKSSLVYAEIFYPKYAAECLNESL